MIIFKTLFTNNKYKKLYLFYYAFNISILLLSVVLCYNQSLFKQAWYQETEFAYRFLFLV